MEGYYLLIILTILTEKITQLVKDLLPESAFTERGKRIISSVIGIALAFTVQVDLLGILGINSMNPYIGTIISGLVISGGANYVHDLFGAIKSIKDNNLVNAEARKIKLQNKE